MATALDGVIVQNRYEIRDHIAAGGMATVYRGWDRTENRPIAIKVLRNIDEMRPKDVDRFRREGRIARELHCSQIVEVYDFVEEDNSCYLVMELVEGVNLKDRVVQQGPLPPAEALRIAAEICHALSCAHEHKFIHRDIKPQNILLATNGEIKLTDFGIVHISESTNFTTSGIVLGTADYISPEQAQGLTLTPASDLYSLGVVLFETLTGSLPFQGTSVVAVAMMHTTKSPPPLRMLNPGVPHRLERIVRRALAKKPDQRFRSAAEMERALLREAETLEHRSGPFHKVQDAEATQLRQGKHAQSAQRSAASRDDLAAMKTQILPDSPALPDWNKSSPNGRFGPPDDLWRTSASMRDDASVPADIVDAYLFTEANIHVNNVARPGGVFSQRAMLVLLALLVIVLILLLPRLL